MLTRTWKAPEIAQRRALSAREIRTQITPEEALAEVRAVLERPAPARLTPPPDPSAARALTAGEVEHLERQGCIAEDWARVRVGSAFDPCRVRHVRFQGDVQLGAYGGEVEIAPGVTHPTGLYDSLVANCAVGDDALVCGVGLLANYHVGSRAVLRDVREATAGAACTFGNGREIAVGIETGGREVLSFAELTIPVAECVAKRRDLTGFLAEYTALVSRYAEAVGLPHGVIGEGAVLARCGRVADVLVGPAARLEGATLVENATLLSSPEEPCVIGDGCIVRDSILQWGCEVLSMSIVTNAVLTEHSHVERHGKVSDAILGPNSGVGEGEVTACLVGPFVAFHHQALLIAAIWPEGRGNIAYGANVGSNHTSRAPDQEIWPGEGVFFGLGCDIKYPANFSDAPYSIVASGVTMLPQRVTMPFSLVNPPARNVEAISPSFNEIMPAWVLYANFYALSRNEAKYRQRDKSRRSQFDFSVFRPEVVRIMVRARDELRSVAETKNFYTDADMAGIGKNYLSESSRAKAVTAYTQHIALFGLRALLEEAEGYLARREAVPPDLLTRESADAAWEFARGLLATEEPDLRMADALGRLAREQRVITAESRLSKERDDHRGSLTIPGFLDAHSPASDDPVIQRLVRETDELDARVARVLESL
jgi:hypothetical protein